MTVVPASAQNNRKSRATTNTKRMSVKSTNTLEDTPDGKLLNLYIDEFIEQRRSGKDGADALAKMNSIYKETADYSGFMSIINKRYTECMEEKKLDDVVRYIDLYCFFAKKLDDRLPEYYEQEGNLFAMLPFDSVRINKCIKNLKEYATLTSTNQNARISKLNEHIEYIRQYVPLYCDINGLWVTPMLGAKDDKPYKQQSGSIGSIASSMVSASGAAPYMILKVEGGAKNQKPNISLLSTSHFAYAASLTGEKAFAQRMEDIGEEATYLAFSNEQLNIPSEAAAGIVTNIASDVGNSIMSRMTSGMSEALGSGLGTDMFSSFMGGMLDLGLNALQKKLSTPSKRVDIAELQMRRFNPNELCGDIHVQTITVKGEEEPVKNQFDATNEVLLRWEEGDGIYFIDPTTGQPLTPSQPTPIDAKIFQKQKKDPNWFFKSDMALLKQNSTMGNYMTMIRTYNKLMLNKLQYTTEQKAKASGQAIPGVHASKQTVAYVGINMEALTPEHKEVQKNPNLKGVKITSIMAESPAFLFGMEKDWIIKAVDGFEFSTPQEIIDYIQSTEPFTPIKFTILKGKKTEDISVTSSFMYL